MDADLGGYADEGAVSWAHAVNDAIFGQPYPWTSERTPWWERRTIGRPSEVEAIFRPRFLRVVHLTRCPIESVAALLGADPASRRFVEAVTRSPPLRSPCSGRHHCAGFGVSARLGWAVAAYVAWNEHLERYADDRVQVEALHPSRPFEDRRRLALRLCEGALLKSLRKQQSCPERVGKADPSLLGVHLEPAAVLPSRRDLEAAVWPEGVDGPVSSLRPGRPSVLLLL